LADLQARVKQWIRDLEIKQANQELMEEETLNGAMALNETINVMALLADKLHDGERAGQFRAVKGALEFRAVQSLSKLDDDETKFRKWHQKMVGAIGQVNTEYGRILDELAEGIDSGKEVPQAVVEIKDQEDPDLVEKLDAELYAIILDKAEGETAYKKVQSVKRNEGIKGYAILYRWFTEISGMGLAEQARRLMQPETPKKEEDIAQAIEEWEMRLTRLAAHGKEYELNAMFKIIALRSLTTGRAREYFEMWESEVSKDEIGYGKLRDKIKEYSKRKQLESRVGKTGELMDCDACDENEYDAFGEDWWQQPDIMAVQKGKGKGNSKGKGKGFQGSCYKCREYGHSARNCTQN
jgi:hypothetical protein